MSYVSGMVALIASIQLAGEPRTRSEQVSIYLRDPSIHQTIT
jgi:hypothetical protein